MMKAILFFILLISLNVVHAQNGQWCIFGIQDTVTGITGKENEIWAATQNAGIKMLDKATGDIITFDVNSGVVSTNRFRCIKYLHQTIYAGTFSDGFYTFQNNIWSHFDTLNSGLAGNNITDFIFDSIENAVWIATDKGLSKWKDNSWENFDSINSGLAGNVLTSLYLDENNILWIGTRFAGMSKLQEGLFTTFNYDNAGINDNWVRTIFADTSGMMYVADYFGVDKYDPVEDIWLYVFNQMTSGLSNERVNKMVLDHQNNLWFATHEGITKWDMIDYWEQFYTSNSDLPHNTSDALYVDSENLVWAGTQGGLAAYTFSGYLFPDFPIEMAVNPNPCTDILHADIKNADKIRLFNMLGDEIFEKSTGNEFIGEYALDIDLRNYASGVYIIVASSGDDYKIQKIIKF